MAAELASLENAPSEDTRNNGNSRSRGKLKEQDLHMCVKGPNIVLPGLRSRCSPTTADQDSNRCQTDLRQSTVACGCRQRQDPQPSQQTSFVQRCACRLAGRINSIRADLGLSLYPISPQHRGQLDGALLRLDDCVLNSVLKGRAVLQLMAASRAWPKRRRTCRQRLNACGVPAMGRRMMGFARAILTQVDPGEW